MGTPIGIDSASNFWRFVRVLVDLDLTKELNFKILVERVGFDFFLS